MFKENFLFFFLNMFIDIIDTKLKNLKIYKPIIYIKIEKLETY